MKNKKCLENENYSHCCDHMVRRQFIKLPSDPENKEEVICFVPYFSEYGIPINDGGNSYVLINFCPWCGEKLPESRRDKWIDAMNELGYTSPFTQKVPSAYFRIDWEEEINKRTKL